MRRTTVKTMKLEGFERNNILIYAKSDSKMSLLWYVEQLMHTAYQIGQGEKSTSKPEEPANIKV